MSAAEDDLIENLTEGYRNSPDSARRLIGNFARELAERQRASGCDDYCRGTDCCGQHGGVADLIDPPTNAGPVRPDEEPTT